MKKSLLTLLALAMLAGCSNSSNATVSETPQASAQATSVPEAADVLTAYRQAWDKSAMSEHLLLLDYMGKKELFPILSKEEVAGMAACEGVEQADIDAQVEERAASLDALYQEVTNFVMNTELVEVEKQSLPDADLLFRLDIKSSENGRFSLAFYNGGFVCIRQVLPPSEGWYQVDEAAVTALKEVIDNGYVLITEENQDKLTCWEAAKLAELLAK